MKPISMEMIASELNLLSKGHPIGELQEIRMELNGLQHLPAHDIFHSATIKEDWACHYGGRKELQFNLGFDTVEGPMQLRYGVAFSFEPSRSLPDIRVLEPKVKLFNQYMRTYPKEFADMKMWHYVKDELRGIYPPAPIPTELITDGVFIFLGKLESLDHLNYELILSTFDRFLPLFEYTLGLGSVQVDEEGKLEPFRFRAGLSKRKASTSAQLTRRELEINLRHNRLQEELYHRLVEKYGKENVSAEQPTGGGTSIDLVVRHEDEYYFYEIKTAISPRACIREALGQILEYSYWPGAKEAARLVIVGESALDLDGRTYLLTLQERFSLPIDYEHIVSKK